MSKMSTQRINVAEKELEKFIKFLALKATQVVVQSRLGEKMQTQCNSLATGEHWFNIDIQDHPDVSAEMKRVLDLAPGQSILQRLPLCVEISLKTVDGDQMVLEVWSLDVQPTKEKDEKIELNGKNGDNGKVNANNGIIGGGIGIGNGTITEQQTLKTAHTIYNRMGILLKSLISLTRAIPAYKLSRRQCADAYGIYYRIYVDRPQVHALGEGYKNVKIGQLNTIVGALTMCVAYRTKMTITPTTVGHVRAGDANIMLKSDHFRPSDGSPTRSYCANGVKKNGDITGMGGERKVIDIDKPLRPGAFTDVGKLRQYTEKDFILPETPPFEWLVRRARCESGGSMGNGGSIESLNRKSESPVSASPLSNGYKYNNNSCASLNNNNNINNTCNTASSTTTTATTTTTTTMNNNNVTFTSLEQAGGGGSGGGGGENLKRKSPTPTPNASTNNSSSNTNLLSQSPAIKSLLVPMPPATRHSSAPTLRAAVAPLPAHDDDNLLKELNFPFASPTSHVNDLAKFYRDCYHAPPLRGLSELQAETATATGCGVSAAYASNSSSADCSAAIDDLSRQLEQFETSLEDYDKLVSQLGMSASSSTGSRSSGGLQMSN